MFKLESYITPVILSYVEKYVKNFKPEQSQVSLWGGDASFQNLDLRLEVLEEQLNLPFTFVSGHIHELLIHVPWVKITSEPIVVTINTIECILKLKDKNQSDNISVLVPNAEIEFCQEETTSGYIKSIVTKVINNITINCNNLILKYVEEDIVLSINVRFLSMQTVNNKWEPAFTDISSYEVRLQKIITIQDLTLCLDKMDASGKIEIYQDPVLYRCSMIIRLIMSYHSNLSKRASITRLDLHCQKMEFSITEQQIPMILRLIALLTLLQSRHLPIVKKKSCVSVDGSDNITKDEFIQASSSSADSSWGMWAWNTVSSVLPMDWKNDWSNEQLIAYSGHVIHFGFYIDDATITFKTVESVKEQLFYKSRKIKYKSFLSLRFSETVFDAILQGISMTNFTIGFGSIRLYPRGTCSCGHLEVIDGVQPPLYLIAGEIKTNYLKNTLFDIDTVENQGKKRIYKKDISFYLASITASRLLERCPAFYMDYIHYLEIPEDIMPELLAEYESNYEYSNFIEERYIRYGIGNLTIRLCSGLFHRIDTIKKAAERYDYSPYNTPKPVPLFDDLPPVTVEEYEALRERIPMVKINLSVTKIAIQLQLADHCITGLPRQQKYVESRTMPVMPILSDDPFISIESNTIFATLEEPLYPFRLVACASKQTKIPPEMLSQCYRDIKVQLQGINSQVYLKKNCRTSIIMPFDIEYNLRMLLYPMYWKNLSTLLNLQNLKINSITITGTKTKLMVATSIITSLLYPEYTNNPFLCSSLYNDSCNEKSPVYIEICLENIIHKGIISMTTTSCSININAIKIFAHNETQQAFILSGPETECTSTVDNNALITAILQFSKEFNNQRHPTILSFHIASMKGSLDPLILQWLNYRVTYYELNTTYSMKPEAVQSTTESAVSDIGSKKKTFPNLHESVHSSSDKEKRKTDETIEKSYKKSIYKNNESDKISGRESIKKKLSILGRLTESYPWWSRLVLNGFVEHIIIYAPTITMSGIGVEGIEEAKEQAVKSNPQLQILIVKLPMINIHSANIQSEHLITYSDDLPIVLPETMWIQQIHSFPWRLEILNFESITLKGNLQCNFIKKLCFKATFDLTIKDPTLSSMGNKLSPLSLCVYIDTSPILISISEEQIIFLYNVFVNIMNLIKITIPAELNAYNENTKDIKDTSFRILRGSSSPTQLPFPDDTASTSTISAIKENIVQVEDNAYITACIQWTITKVSLKLYIMEGNEYATYKLVLDLEDIITSIDIQSVYLKLKHKITTATIFHYTRKSQFEQWDFGEYVGLVLCGKEDNFEKSEDSGFLNLTLTIAKSGNVHTRWGALKSCKIQKDSKAEALQPSNAYITEAVVKIQTVDITIPPKVLEKYVQLLKPFLNTKSFYKNSITTEKKITTPFIGITNLRNESLPLIYLEFKGFRLMLPVASESIQEFQHDLLMLKLDDIRITPHAENPICREPLRSDIYQLAAQANILNVPGSAVEDRQYQINVDGICAHTTTWKNYQQSVTKRMSQSYLYTMNENPAVEWNKLGNRSNLESHFSTLPVITRFDFCFIIAPVIMFKPETMVCASAAEINCLTDLELIVNLNQIKLISMLLLQLKSLLSFNEIDIPVENYLPESENHFKKFTVSSDSKNTSLTKQIIPDSKIDFIKDSRNDLDISSLNSTNLEKPLIQETEFSTFEFLINCGKITMVVYDIKKPTTSKNTINGIEDEKDDANDLKQPLFYAMINQLNFYFSQQNYDQKLQVSCFDVALHLSDIVENYSTSIPTHLDFKICLIETKSGEAHPDTGIPPSFLVVKFDVFMGKNPQLNINMGRPTKMHFSFSRLKNIFYIRNEVSMCFMNTSIIEQNTINSTNDTCIKGCLLQLSSDTENIDTFRKYDIPDINIMSKQFVFSFKSDSEAELLFSLSSLYVNVSNVLRSEKIYANLKWDSFIISAILDSKITVLLNPCSCNIIVYMLWECWQGDTNAPQIQIQIESNCIYLDFGPKHILILKLVLSEFHEIVDELLHTSQQYKKNSTNIIINEQYYKDDLKSGAFQFVDGNAEELPFPYQVVFFSFPEQTMAWRYPHPRALTKIHVSPVPLQIFDTGLKIEDRVPCVIEYWSESQMAYQRYVDFYISETENYILDLPNRIPLQVVACIWRIVVRPNFEMTDLISSKTLIGCLQIDSYFNHLIVPKIQAIFSVREFHISFYNHLDPNYYEMLPPPLNNYKLNSMIPDTQCFALFKCKEAVFMFNKWSDDSVLSTLTGNISLYLLDYALLLLQEMLETVNIKAQISITSSCDVSLICQPFVLKLSPSTFHTLAVAAHLWNNMLDRTNKYTLVLTTRYVIANDTNIAIRFGQSGTDDNILLESRQCHFYSWRVTSNQVLRIAIEENGWIWSKPFSVNTNGSHHINFNNSSLDMVIFINVASLSASEKIVTFSGQLIISNQMVDSFEMKLVKYDSSNNRSIIFHDILNIPTDSEPLSIVIHENNVAMRLRFSNTSNLFWTGDIPLQPNVRWGQPWLVKVPLQEKGQFISIWVRIIIEQLNGRNKILAIISPLYMIRSYLPVPAQVKIETPLLNTTLNTVIYGRGKRQQLYCPGTFEHFHQLTFQLETGISASDPYVPLSYNSIDQRNFFKRPDKESIQDILIAMKTAKEESKWPFQTEEGCTWIAADQPQTHVQVKYEDAGLGSSTLLLELQPWCFILNSLGIQISIISKDEELCRIPHYGVVASPKIEGVFYIGISIGDTIYLSSILQFITIDWNQSLYASRTEGMIPLEGNLKTCIKCRFSICLMNINSSICKDMRIIRIISNYVIGNMTDYEIHVATLAIPNSSTDLRLPNDLTSQSISISSSRDERYAVPIVRWHTLFDQISESFVLYISLRLNNKLWSCPVRIDQSVSRRCIALPNGRSTVPIVITTQEDNNTTYIMIHKDKHPQLFIENTCSFNILITEVNGESGDVILDAQHFLWKCEIESNSSYHYSIPSIATKLPDLPNNNYVAASISISAIPITEESHHKCSFNNEILHWSRSIDLTNFMAEQFVQLPFYGDVKLTMQTQGYTSYICFSSVSQIEMSVQGIKNKIEKKCIQQNGSNEITDNFSIYLEEEKTPLQLQSDSSSASIATFFSAQDEISETNLLSFCTSSLSVSNELNNLQKKNTVLMTTYENRTKQNQNYSVTVHFHGFSIVLMTNLKDNAQRIEVANLYMIDAILMIDCIKSHSKLCMYVGDLQLDNLMFENGSFDFPVVLMNQNSFDKKNSNIYLNNSIRKNIENLTENSLIKINLTWELDCYEKVYKQISIQITPVRVYLEGNFLALLMDCAASIFPPCFMSILNLNKKCLQSEIANNISIPDYILVDSKVLSYPLRLQSFVIEPVSIILSVHTSLHLYVAFDHSPLHFEVFHRKNLMATPYRLGNALAMHYLSGAIFGIGWVVGSLEILGSPGGLAQALGSGLKDFISMPFQGLLQGPWGFIVGITHGSASLIKHITAGTVNSVTKLASSVARNLDRLTLDKEHLQRQEELRRMRPQGVAQGLYQGLSGLGMNILAAIAGLAHHPLQQVWSGETSTKGLVTGVGLGLVGVVTKPLSGAAELVALTGQGLLQGTGWNSLPMPRQRSVLQYINEFSTTSLRYTWRLMPLLIKSHDSILHISNADHVMLQNSNRAVTLVLTRQALLIVNIDEDSVEKIFPLKDLTAVDHPNESNIFRLYCSTTQPSQHFRKVSPAEQIEMDEEMRARVAEFLRTSSTGIASISTNSDAQSEMFNPVSLPDPENTLIFYINSNFHNYLISIFNVAKRQNQGHGFTVI